MKIIILGAGQVGSTAAQQLAREQANDVTVVDTRDDVLRELQDRLDISTVSGNAAHPATLLAAGSKGADLIVALTSSDEVNMIACQIAWTLFRTPTKIARIRSGDYYGRPELFGENAIPVDLAISPEQLVTEYVERLIRYPGALQVLEFAEGRVLLVGMRALKGGKLVGHQLQALRSHIPNREVRVAAIYRGGRSIHPEGDTTIEEHDEVFFVAARDDMRFMMKELSTEEASVRRVVIAGAGNIGFRLAQALEDRVQVKLIERNPERSRRAAETLRNTLVLTGNAADEDLLLEENIDDADAFVAVTNAEEANILSAMLAKKLGARRVMALINKPSYADLMENGPIDIAISPQTVTIGALLEHVRRGDVVRVHSLRRGAAEAMEAIVHTDGRSSPIAGKRIEEIDLPEGTQIGAVVRGSTVIMAHHDTVIEAEDHVILFLTDRRHVDDVGRLFQAGIARHELRDGAADPRADADDLQPDDAAADRRFLPLRRRPLAAVPCLGWSSSHRPGCCSGCRCATSRRELRLRDGFLIVAVFWIFLGLAGATPLLPERCPATFRSRMPCSRRCPASRRRARRSSSGSTSCRSPSSTTGSRSSGSAAWASSCSLSRSCRSSASAACRSTRRKRPGPMKDQKLTPRITQTAKALWAIYASLTIACALCFWLAGMNRFDAIGHAFSTRFDRRLLALRCEPRPFRQRGRSRWSRPSSCSLAARASRCTSSCSGAEAIPELYWRDTEFQGLLLLIVRRHSRSRASTCSR